MEDDVVPSRTQFAVAGWLTLSVYCITNIPAEGMEHTMANIRAAYGKREQVNSSSSDGGNVFVSAFVSRTEVPTFKMIEKKQFQQFIGSLKHMKNSGPRGPGPLYKLLSPPLT